jgi:hypothetical protein
MQKEALEEGEEQVQAQGEPASRMTRLKTLGAAAVCAGALLGAGASQANADVLFSASLDLTADPATVGQTNLPGSMTIGNFSSAPNAKTGLITEIRLTPSCGEFTFSPCSVLETGVITVNPTATGAAGSACAGGAFNFPVTNPTTGDVTFTAEIGNEPSLPVGQECVVNFTYNVGRSPAVDSQPGEDGIQTDQILRVRFFHPDDFGIPEEFGSDFTTISPLATPPAGPTGQRAAALKKCKKKRAKKAKRKCRRKANLLPV